jgi:hypothetical protein
MNRLPSSGPGRPQHLSYSNPGPAMTLLEALIFFLAIAFIVGLIILGKAVM